MAYECTACNYKHVTEDKPTECLNCGQTSFRKIEDPTDQLDELNPNSFRYQFTRLLSSSIEKTITLPQQMKQRSVLLLLAILVFMITVLGILQILFFY